MPLARAPKAKLATPKKKGTGKNRGNSNKHFSDAAEFKEYWTNTRDDTVILFVYSDSCPYCVMMQPAWQEFVESKPSIVTASVKSDAFAPVHQSNASAFGNVPFRGVPLVMLADQDGSVDDFDVFAQSHNVKRTSKGLQAFVNHHNAAAAVRVNAVKATKTKTAPRPKAKTKAKAKATAKSPAKGSANKRLRARI